MTKTIPALLVCFAAAQAAAHLEGTIRDGSLAVVPGASILCVAEDAGFRFQTESDPTGNYDLIVPEGSYNIIVRHAGFESIARIGVQVLRAGIFRADFELKLGGTSETIRVIDISQTIEPTEAATTILSPEELRRLPRNDGTVTGLLALAQGILFTPASRGESGQFSSSGARPNTNRFTVDGVSANNAVAGAGWPGFLPGGRLPEMTALGTTHDLALFDAIQDVRVEAQGEGAGVAQTPGRTLPFVRGRARMTCMVPSS